MRPSTFRIARQAYEAEGVGVFFRGLGICSARAFFVNAVQWAVSISHQHKHNSNTNNTTGLRVDDESASFLTLLPSPLLCVQAYSPWLATSQLVRHVQFAYLSHFDPFNQLAQKSQHVRLLLHLQARFSSRYRSILSDAWVVVWYRPSRRREPTPVVEEFVKSVSSMSSRRWSVTAANPT